MIGQPDLIKRTLEMNPNICSFCEHAEADKGCVRFVIYECDSFGKEGHAMCIDCMNEHEEREAAMEIHCHDCGTTLTIGTANKWQAYDHDPSQGDVELYICDNCLTAETHLARVAANKEAYHQDFGDDIDFDDD